MNFVTLPQALFVFYGTLVLACGVGLGVIIGRNWGRRRTTLPPVCVSAKGASPTPFPTGKRRRR